MTMRATALLLLATTSGCSVLLDTIYLAGDKKFDTTKVERSPTTETWQGIELSARALDGGGLELTCAQTTRSIDREWSVHRTWQRRGGFDRDAYLGTAIVSGFLGALIGGSLLGICLNEESDVDCAWTATAAPLVLDAGYGLIRRATTYAPKLIARNRSGDSIALGAVITAEPTACPALQAVAIGHASGHTPEQALRAESPQPLRLHEGSAMQLPLAGSVATLTPQIAENWRPSLGLWAIDSEGVAHAVTVDRCAVMRPFVPQMMVTSQNQFNAECPLIPAGGSAPPLGVPR